jgi:hypothetical protein
MVLPGVVGQSHVAIIEQEMIVRRSNVNMARIVGLAILGMGRQQRSRPAQDIREKAFPNWRKMTDDEETGGQAGRQTSGKLREDFHAAGRGADNDDVVTRHETHPLVLGLWSSPT